MPTIVNITVAPSGGDYTSLNAALASIPVNIVTTDEQYNVNCETFVGGLNETVTFPAITQDATRFVRIQAAVGHEYDPVNDVGFYLIGNIGFAGVFTNSVNFVQLMNFGVKNSRTTASGRGIDFFGDNGVISGMYAKSDSSSGATIFNLNNANNLNISECLAYNGNTGFDFGNNGTRIADKLTSVDAATAGIDTGTAITTITNSLSITSADPYLGTFSGSSSNNASSSTDAPGTSPQNNRTTADFVNYAGSDYRTSSSSSLATAGVGGTFIGYAVEALSGITANMTEAGPSFSENSTVNASTPISATLIEQGPSFTESVSVNVTKNLTANITEIGPSFTESVNVNLTGQGLIASMAEQGPSFSESINAALTVNVSANISESGPSFSETINAQLSADILATISESGPSFAESSVLNIPVFVTVSPKNTVRVKRKSNSVKIKKSSNTIRVT